MSTSLLAVFTEQAGFCRQLGSAFTGALIDALTRDIETEGPTATLVRDWPVERARADALPLRLVGALHAAVLTGRDAGLASEYPPARADWDRFGYHTSSWSWGSASPVRIETDWRGAPPPLDAKPNVRSRAGCDLAPPDLRQREDLLRLRSYIWPDQPERLERFDAAAALALSLGVRPEAADAGEWLERRLATRAPDALTVVYHSIFYPYPSRETRARIRAAIESAGRESAPLAWLRLEPEATLGGPRDSLRILLDLVTYPGARRETLALTDGHVRFVDTRVSD